MLSDLIALLNGEIAALRIPDFTPVDLAGLMAEALLNDEHFGRYANAAKIGRVGRAFFESNGKPQERAAYLSRAIDEIHHIRWTFAPFLSPIDKLRLLLDEIWPEGATLLTLTGQKLFVGLARSFDGAGAEPHQDVLAWDAPEFVPAHRLRGQFAFNAYLKLPERGGELQLWNLHLNRTEYDARRQSEPETRYGLRRESLPLPDIELKPRVGELILFDANRIHAVLRTDDPRVSVSAFIGFQGDDRPLVLWS